MLPDVRYAVRTLLKSPGFAAIAVLTLALGIGANTAIFSVCNAVLLRPLPLKDPSRLAVISSENLDTHAFGIGMSWPKFQMVAEQSRTLDGFLAYTLRDFVISDGKTPQQIRGGRVTASFFQVLGVQPMLGRGFDSAEDHQGGAPVAVLSYSLWQRSFGGDPNIVGRPITVDGQSTEVVGVLPREFKFQFSAIEPEILLPRVFEPGGITEREIRSGAGYLFTDARLRPGVSIAEAQAELNTINVRYRQAYGSNVDAAKNGLHCEPFIDNLVGPVRPALLVLLAAVGLVLLIACANVAHLLLAKAAAQERETTIRIALGGSMSHLVRQFMAESLILSTLGCGVGLVIASWAISLFSATGPLSVPRLQDTSLDPTVAVFAMALSVITAVLFSMAPLLHAARLDLNSALREASRNSSQSRRSGFTRNVLAVSQTALALALLIGAEVLIANFVRLEGVNPGFDYHNVLTASVALPPDKYPPARQERFYTDAIERIRTLPGVQSAAAISFLPMGTGQYGFYFFVEGTPSLGLGRDPVIWVKHVSADYFRTMRIPLLAGRAFTEQDAANSTPVAIINETTARKYFPGRSPLGRHLANSRDRLMREVVGVVSDVRFAGPDQPPSDELYLPYRQVAWPAMTLVVRTGLDPLYLAAAIKREIAKIDPDQPVASVLSMEQLVSNAVSRQRFTTFLLAAFAFLALVLASIGLYGVIAFFVVQRTREIGIRIALGAQRGDVLRMVAGQGLKLTLAGIVVGLIGAYVGIRFMSSLVSGMEATLPAFVVGPVFLIAIALGAALMPARRAARVDPIEALRAE
ncbi:MAG TPA: ABC transporter permease [Bryobacteraceae bacterium]|nr:ABC transporter permease [Bryobacteraceae bacterium]